MRAHTHTENCTQIHVQTRKSHEMIKNKQHNLIRKHLNTYTLGDNKYTIKHVYNISMWSTVDWLKELLQLESEEAVKASGGSCCFILCQSRSSPASASWSSAALSRHCFSVKNTRTCSSFYFMRLSLVKKTFSAQEQKLPVFKKDTASLSRLWIDRKIRKWLKEMFYVKGEWHHEVWERNIVAKAKCFPQCRQQVMKILQIRHKLSLGHQVKLRSKVTVSHKTSFFLFRCLCASLLCVSPKFHLVCRMNLGSVMIPY